MLGSLLLSSPADAEPEGPRELLAPATPVLLAGRVGYSERVGADQKKSRRNRGGERVKDRIREYGKGRRQKRKKTESIKAQ